MSKKNFIISLVLLIVLSITIVFADNNVSFGNTRIEVKEDTVSVNISVSGYVTNIPFNVKVLDEEGNLVYLNAIYPTNNYISFSFTPNVEKETNLILKVSGVSTLTRTFKYSNEDITADTLSQKEKEALEEIKNTYGVYEDYVGDIVWKDIKMTTSTEIVRLNMYAESVKSTDNVWKNKDAERWNYYLEAIADLIINKTGKDVRIICFDANNNIIDNKSYDKEGTWVKNVPQLIKDLNKEFSTMKVENKSFGLKYERGDNDEYSETAEILYIDVTCKSISSSDVKEEIRRAFTTFFDDVYDFIVESKFYNDVTFRLYDKDGYLYNNYVYIADSIYDENKYKPLDEKRGTFPIELFDYGTNSVILPQTSMNMSIDNKTVTVTIDDSSAVLSTLGKLTNSSQRQLVIGIDPSIVPERIIVNVNKSVMSVLSNQGVMLTINHPLMQANIDCSKITANDTIVFDVSCTEEMPYDTDMTMSQAAYEVSLKTFSGVELSDLGNVKLIYRTPPKNTVELTDSRKVGVFKYSESEMIWNYQNATWIPGLQGYVFFYEGSGKYAPGLTETTFVDIEGHWAQDVIEVMAAKRMVAGVGYNMFKPDDTISRAEFCTIISRHLGVTSTETYYSDPVSWWNEYVSGLRSINILPQSMCGAVFNPDTPITREEMAYISVEAYKYATGKSVTPSTALYSDVNSISNWAYNHVSIAQELRIMVGDNNGNFMPLANATRAQASQVIYNLLVVEGMPV